MTPFNSKLTEFTKIYSDCLEVLMNFSLIIGDIIVILVIVIAPISLFSMVVWGFLTKSIEKGEK